MTYTIRIIVVVVVVFSLLVYMREDSTSRTIYKTAALNGTHSTVVAKTDHRSSNSFVVSAHEEMVYWSDVQDNCIRQFDLDGNLRKTSSPPKLYRFIMDLVSVSAANV